MDIEFVRSRFIKHFDGQTGNIYFSPGRISSRLTTPTAPAPLGHASFMVWYKNSSNSVFKLADST